MAIKQSKAVRDEVERLLDGPDPGEAENLLWEEADSSCTTGYDNDGSTGLEIFLNGCALAATAAGRDIVQVDHPGTNVALFFIGTEEEVLKRIRSLS
jgi:hypothetical protein